MQSDDYKDVGVHSFQLELAYEFYPDTAVYLPF